MKQRRTGLGRLSDVNLQETKEAIKEINRRSLEDYVVIESGAFLEYGDIHGGNFYLYILYFSL